MFVCISGDSFFCTALTDFLKVETDYKVSVKSVPSVIELFSGSKYPDPNFNNHEVVFLIDLSGPYNNHIAGMRDLRARFPDAVVILMAEKKEMSEISLIEKDEENFIILAKEDFPSFLPSLISILKVILRNNRLVNKTELEQQDESKSNMIIAGLMETIRTKDKFISLISHDLKDPLLSLSGISDILLADWHKMDDSEKLEIIKEVKESSRRTYQLVDNISSWSKKTLSRIEASPQVLYIRDILVPSIEIAELVANHKKINIINEVDEDVLVKTDRNMIFTVLRNLLLNAVKYTPSGGDIKISAERKEDSCQFCISDNGNGIENPYIIELFKNGNLDSSLNGLNGNENGIGLLFCKEFIEKSGGHIWLETKQGSGTQFYFTVPC